MLAALITSSSALAPRALRRRLPLAIRACASTADEGPSTLAEIPDFWGQNRILKAAFKASKLVKPNHKLGNPKKRATRYATDQIQAYHSTISVSLRDQLRHFDGVMRRLSPFERALAELTLASLERNGSPSLKQVLADADRMRRAVVRTGKEAIADAMAAESKRDAEKIREEGVLRVEQAFRGEAAALDALIATAQKLRRLPKVAADEPVIVLLGMPNVGKSSIVSATSTKDPEINDYPFTTRALKLGHVVDPSSTRFQLMDTPGVLLRAEGERNAMEGLTLAAVRHLPSAVVFVMDLSGTCGEQSAPELQLAVRDQLRAQFGRRPWIDVRSKADLPLADGLPAERVPDGALAVSVHEDAASVDALRCAMVDLVAAGVPSVDSLEGDLPGEDLVVKTVVDRDAAPSDWGSDWR